jgi:ATP phosphoribosyltransferase
MLRIAVQSKGRLFEETMALLQEADIKISASKRILLVQSSNFPIEVLFLPMMIFLSRWLVEWLI